MEEEEQAWLTQCYCILISVVLTSDVNTLRSVVDGTTVPCSALQSENLDNHSIQKSF